MVARALLGFASPPPLLRGSPQLAALRAWARLPREQAWGRLRYKAIAPCFALPLYPLTLTTRVSTALFVSPPDPWPGNAEAGRAIVHGSFTLAGRTLRYPAPLWEPLGAGRRFSAALNGFSWLRDLRAAGGDGPRRAARELVTLWLDANETWNPLSWDPVVTGERLANWLGQYDFYAASADIDFRHRLLGHMARQARHLARVLPAGLGASDALTAIKGLVLAGVCLPAGEAWLARGLALLRRELPRQILADGGHVERSPARQMQVLRDLIDLRAALHAGEMAVPPDLQAAIEQMTPMLRLFQHGDGALALFNGSNESEGWLVDMVLQRADGRGRTILNAPDSGFQRLHAGRSLVIVDTGAPPPPGADRDAHAGTLSFEMSVGRERLIVNCGAFTGDGPWRQAQRTTAAHSTLVLDDRNSSEILRDGGLARRPRMVTCRRHEAEGDILLDLSHDGYEALGALHHRQLYLSANGEDLRGEDRLEGPATGDFALRFHLHPEVQASLSQSGETALLRLAKAGGWRLRARGAELRLEESIYLGQDSVLRRSQQIVLSGSCRPGQTVIKWALQREAKPRAQA